MKNKALQKWILPVCLLSVALVGCRTVHRNSVGASGSATDFVDSAAPHRTMVSRIESVDASLDRAVPAQIVAHVRADVTSLGWINPEFVPFEYTEPPKDGIYEFVLTAERPGGIVAPRITPLTAELVWRNPPPGVKGIRIHAVENKKEDRL